METTHKLVWSKEQSNYTLHRNEKQCDCPFQPAVVVPTQLNSISITKLACNSDCALMKLNVGTLGKALVELKCAGDYALLNVHVEEKDETPKLKLR